MIRTSYRAHSDTPAPVFGIGIYRSDGTYVNGSNHHWREHPLEIKHVVAGERGEVDMAIPNLPLLEGTYYLTAFLYDHSKPSPTAIDHREHVTTFQVVDGRKLQHGVLKVDSRWTVRRTRPGAAEPSVEESET